MTPDLLTQAALGAPCPPCELAAVADDPTTLARLSEGEPSDLILAAGDRDRSPAPSVAGRRRPTAWLARAWARGPAVAGLQAHDALPHALGITLPRLPASGAPPAPPARTLLLAGLGAGLAILALALLAQASGAVLLMAPFGASAVLLFALPDAPLSQPRAVIGGHLVATAVGLLVAQFLGTGPVAMALALGLSVCAMLLTRTTHAPAGANPLLVMLTGQGWGFLVAPVGVGAVLLVLAAWLHHRVSGTARYPKYWY